MLTPLFAGALNATHGDSQYTRSQRSPVIMAYPDCSGTEDQLSNCEGFVSNDGEPYIPSRCTRRTVAGVKCVGELSARCWPFKHYYSNLAFSMLAREGKRVINSLWKLSIQLLEVHVCTCIMTIDLRVFMFYVVWLT